MQKHRSLLAKFSKSIRFAIIGMTLGIIVWSFIWVGTRPLRKKQELGNRVELLVMHWGSRETDQLYQRLVDNFEQTHPQIKIKRINVPGIYMQKLQTLFAAGDPADVMMFLDRECQDFARAGLLLELDSLLTLEARSDNPYCRAADFYPKVLDLFRHGRTDDHGGFLYGLPTGFTTRGFYYNKKLFDQAGVAYPTDDWTWEEFEEKARAIGRLNGVYGCELYRFIENVELMLLTYGSSLFTPGFKSVCLDDSAFFPFLHRLRNWQMDDPKMLTQPGNPISTEGAFIAGKIGMLGPAGRWVTMNFRKITKFDWDYVQLPRGSRRVNSIEAYGWSIAKDSKHPREAWEVVRYFCSMEAQRIVMSIGESIPSLKALAESDAFLKSDLNPKRNDMFLIPINITRQLHRPVDHRLVTLTDGAIQQSLMYGTKTPEEAFRNLNETIQKENRSPLLSENYSPMPWRKIITIAVIPVLAVLLIGIMLWWRQRPRGLVLQEEVVGMGMVTPWVFGFLSFTAIPMIISLLLVMTKWNGISTLDHAQWVGLANFVHMFKYDVKFWQSLWVTFYYAILIIPSGQLLALAVAMLMNNQVKGINLYRSIWYLPSVLTGVGVAILWLWVFNSTNGLLNRVLAPALNLVGLTPPDWFGKDAAIFGIPAFVIMGLWGVGGGMLIYLAGLNAIPLQLYEAARIDGAGWWKRFFKITLPMLSPVILFQGIMAIIGSFQVFTQAYIMTYGGTNDSTLFYALYLYLQAFEYHNMSYASAMAWFLFVIILILTIITIRLGGKRVHYEGQKL